MRQICLLIATLGLLSAQTSHPASAFENSSEAQTTAAPVNRYGLTAAMIAPCDDWLAIRSPYYAEAQTMDFSNLEYALLTPPYENTDFAEIEITREFIERREEIVQVMERRDHAEMSEIIGRVYEGLEYYDHLKREEQFLCMLYVREQQLTGGPFRRVFRSPASLGITPEIAEALRRQPSYP